MIRLPRLLLAGALALAACAKTAPAPGGLGDQCVNNNDCASGFLCAAGRCVLPANLGGCEPGRKRCNGAEVEQCGPDGLGYTLVTSCPTGCSAGACRPQVCTPGARRCEGDAAEQCTPAGDAWALVQVCPAHCDASTGQCKAPICTPFATRCSASSNAVETCDSFGAQWVVTPCNAEKVCDTGRCLDVICTPGATRCSSNGGSIETCNDKGDGWTFSAGCSFGCGSTGSGAACSPAACAANESRCNSGAIERCKPDQTGWAFVAFCATGCVVPTGSTSAQCAAPVCAPSARRCTADQGGVEVCSADGTGWALVDNCPQGCAGGQCVTTTAGCMPGDLRCNGADAQACEQASPGVTQWKTTETCLAGCSSGACAAGGSCLAGSLKLNAAVSTVPMDPNPKYQSSVLVYSDLVTGKDGAPIPDGTAFTISVSAPAGSPQPAIASADMDAATPGMQVRSLKGRIHFVLLAPASAPADFVATATATLTTGASCAASVPLTFTLANAGQTILVAEDFTKTTLRNLPATSADWNTSLGALAARWPASNGAGSDGPLCVAPSAQTATTACPTWQVATTFNLTTSGYAPSFAVLGLTAQSATVDAVPQGLSGGDEVILWNTQGSSSGFANAGTYESLRVATVDGSTVTFTEPVKGTYGAVVDQNVSTQKVQLVRVPQFRNVTVLAGAKITASAWNGSKGGLLAMRVGCPAGLSPEEQAATDCGTAKVQGELSMDTSGYRGGAATGAVYAEDQTSYPSLAASSSVTGAGAGGLSSGGSFGTLGAGASTGQMFGLPLVGRLFLGAGGGGNNSTTVGGAGGGAILLFAKKVTLANDSGNAQGRVHADGGPTCAAGLGSGGTVWVAAPTLILGNPSGGVVPVSVRGAGATCNGGGGGGRVRLDYQTSTDAAPCTRTAPATGTGGTCSLGVAGPLAAQSLDAYVTPSSLTLKQATLVTALGDTDGAAFFASAKDADAPDFGQVPGAAAGQCPASTVCFNSTATTPTQGPRFRWKVTLSPQPSSPQFLHALQWSLKAQ